MIQYQLDPKLDGTKQLNSWLFQFNDTVPYRRRLVSPSSFSRLGTGTVRLQDSGGVNLQGCVLAQYNSRALLCRKVCWTSDSERLFVCASVCVCAEAWTNGPLDGLLDGPLYGARVIRFPLS